MTNHHKDKLTLCLEKLSENHLTPLDYVSRRTTVEKLIELVIAGVPTGSANICEILSELSEVLNGIEVDDVNVLVFGGGTGLSTVIGGDSRNCDWPGLPFQGLKEIFPKTKAVVCVTDDGGSTGELLKDLPIIGLGDLRHVLLSALQKATLQDMYQLNDHECVKLVKNLHTLFNFRFDNVHKTADELINSIGIDFTDLPDSLAGQLIDLIEETYKHPCLIPVLQHSQCLGNLILAAAIFQQSECHTEISSSAVRNGINFVGQLIGVKKDQVMPCSTTPCQLKLMYSNGVLITGESKSASARRGCPVGHAFVEFACQPQVRPEIFSAIKQADIIIFAPGSLYTSVVPVLQVPGISDAVKKNSGALKILAANIWAQSGETDLAPDDPARRYHVSDLIKAYHRNVPLGVRGLFNVIMSLGLRDISGSIIQGYAVEGKTPIYLDRGNVWKMGFTPVEANIFSQQALRNRNVKHDPSTFAEAIRVLWVGKNHLEKANILDDVLGTECQQKLIETGEFACSRFKMISEKLKQKEFAEQPRLLKIFWHHKDIPIEHLNQVDGFDLIDVDGWRRSQEWDNVFSFYDPGERRIKIRKDMLKSDKNFEIAFLVALGQSLLGDYARKKLILSLTQNDDSIGRVYKIFLNEPEDYSCYFNRQELENYLVLARMNKSSKNEALFTRVLNSSDGFTPPGMLFGLIYAWYLDNQFASHVEYKMSIARMPVSDLVPEQVRTLARRNATIEFFRKSVFRQDLEIYDKASRKLSES